MRTLTSALRKAFSGEIFLDELRILVDHVVRKLGAALEFELFEQVFLVAFGDALETPVIDAGTFLQENFQVEAVAFDGRTDADVRKEALVPQAGDGCRDEVAGQVYRIARDKTRRSSQNAVVNVLRPVNIDVADVVKFLGTAFERRGFFELL